MKLILFLIQYIFCYLQFYRRAQTRYDVHSPFVSEFLARTVEDQRWYYIFDQITTLREKLALNDDPVEIVDFGAGSQLGRKESTTVNKIARYSAISPSAGRLLFRIAHFLRPNTFLELGTSLGISAMYQISANLKGQMISMEGNPALADLARSNLRAAGLAQVTVRAGQFRELLPELIEAGTPIDFFHFDGDHRYQPTIDYFEQCLRICHNDSVFCIGDIYWSADMKKSWLQLKKHPSVRLSIDLFHFGLLFLRSEQKEKEDFTLIAARWKPWRRGFWG